MYASGYTKRKKEGKFWGMTSSSEESSKEEKMRLFVMHYNRNTRKNGLKQYNKNLMKFRNYNPLNKLEDKKME